MSLSDLQKKLDSALKQSPDINLLSEIKATLYNVPINEREKYKSFVKIFQQKLFEKGIELTGAEFNGYFIPQIEKPKKQKKEYYNQKVEFNEILKKLISSLGKNIDTLKNYFLVNLTNDEAKDYELLIVSDNEYFLQPLERGIKGNFPNAEYISLEDISTEIESSFDTTKNYLTLFLLETRKGNSSSVKTCLNKIKILINTFQDFSAVYFKNQDIDDTRIKIIEQKDKTEFIDEVEFVISSFLTNVKLSNEEEKIIKKLLASIKCPLIEYRILVKGFSGANVIEVKPKRSFATNQSRRYIIKYSKLDDNRKLKLEDERFNKALKFEGFRDYSCTRVQTKTHEGLIYEYAKTDFLEESFPFSEVISKTENKYHHESRYLIEKLHNIPPFELWLKSEKLVEEIIYNRYREFVKPKKTKVKIANILNIKLEELEQKQFIKDFNKICELELPFNIKICHGDLHTNNFFIDEGIYLIDFGLTDYHHSLIDFSCLEASIKFNHFPKYLTIDELKSIEDLLLDETVFTASYSFKSYTRPELIVFLELLHENRLQSKRHITNTTSHIEYYLSLYFMTIKQIRYSDMNQLYALESMKKLGSKILKSV